MDQKEYLELPLEKRQEYDAQQTPPAYSCGRLVNGKEWQYHLRQLTMERGQGVATTGKRKENR